MSHHGSNPISDPDFLRRMQRDLQGEFPEGRLNGTDQGAVAMMVGHERGKVVIQFPHPTSWVGLSPQQALDLASSLIQHAKECGGVLGIFELKL